MEQKDDKYTFLHIKQIQSSQCISMLFKGEKGYKIKQYSVHRS
jgi:hypothetical protein